MLPCVRQADITKMYSIFFFEYSIERKGLHLNKINGISYVPCFQKSVLIQFGMSK